jgi:hypothetical protein
MQSHQETGDSGRVEISVFGSQNGEKQRNWDKVSQSVPVKTAPVPVPLGQVKPSNGKAYSRFFASVPVVPVKNHGTGKQAGKITHFCSPV